MLEDGVGIMREPRPFGFRASYSNVVGFAEWPWPLPTIEPKSAGVLVNWNTFASGFNPFFGLSLSDVENHLRLTPALSTSTSSSSRTCTGSERARFGGDIVARCMFIESDLRKYSGW